MRLIYFLYFIITADYTKVWKSIRCQKTNYSSLKLILDSLWCSFYYGTSLIDYFNFRFFEKKHDKRDEFASTLFMYKFHKALNQKAFLNRVDNKIEFSKYYREFAPPSAVFNTSEQSGIDEFIAWIRKNNYYDIVVKDPSGTTGTAVYLAKYYSQTGNFQVNGLTFPPESFWRKYSRDGIIYVQPRLKQHPLINVIAPTALNTIRIITIVNSENQAEIIAAVFRITVDSNIDNYSAGNIAAPIDINTGKVIGPGRKKMAACSPLYYNHPVTQKEIKGFEIPLWNLAIETVKRAALTTPEVRTVGWDLAILSDNVKIIEGNPKWNKDTPQIPLSKGIKNVLKKYL